MRGGRRNASGDGERRKPSICLTPWRSQPNPQTTPTRTELGIINLPNAEQTTQCHTARSICNKMTPHAASAACARTRREDGASAPEQHLLLSRAWLPALANQTPPSMHPQSRGTTLTASWHAAPTPPRKRTACTQPPLCALARADTPEQKSKRAADAATLPPSGAHRPVPPVRRAASPLPAMPSSITDALFTRVWKARAHIL